jgi:hypothetical protein
MQPSCVVSQMDHPPATFRGGSKGKRGSLAGVAGGVKRGCEVGRPKTLMSQTMPPHCRKGIGKDIVVMSPPTDSPLVVVQWTTKTACLS